MPETYGGMDTLVRSGDLCVFKRVEEKPPSIYLVESSNFLTYLGPIVTVNIQAPMWI